jgi:hypothetical protein
MNYATIMLQIFGLYRIEIDRKKAVKCECWKVRVGKEAVEPAISCYADIHTERGARAVRPLTADVRLRSRSGSVGFVVDKVTSRQVLFRVLRFPCYYLPTISPYSLRYCYRRCVTLAMGRVVT